MENSKKRWSVTYTKHIKQKRKVYQDGFLDLHISSNKAMLFDDCDKLLEIKILKGEEVVRSGETVTFNGYLVDIADPEGVIEVKPQQPVFESTFKERERPRPNLMRRNKFQSPVSPGDNSDVSEKSKTLLNNRSPSYKVIREFKKSESLRYGALKSRPETVNTGVTEWHVLYTTQVTQKAKKYHDGFLKLKNNGTSGRQIMLYDASKTLLNTRFLKNDEIIGSDESIKFDTYLVDVGEPEGDNQVFVDLTADGNISNVVGKERIKHEHQNSFQEKKFLVAKGENAGSRGISDADTTKISMSVPPKKSLRDKFKKSESLPYRAVESCPETANDGVTEWHVLYTTQMTQKAKRYHDGFLRLKNCGTLGRQIMLYDASKTLLNTRFLKKDEIVRSDESVKFDAHLVDVGEPEGDNQVFVDLAAEGNTINVVGKKRITHEHQNCFEEKKFMVAKGENAGSRGISAADTTKISMTVPQNKSLRDVNEILSILQKPIAPRTVIPGCIERSVIPHVYSAEGLQVSDAEVDYPKERMLPKASIQDNAPTENNINGGSSKGMPTSLTSAQLSSAGGSENPDQEDHTKADTIRCNEAMLSGCSSSADASVRNGSTDDKMMSSEKHTNERKLNEWPSFDLGF
ncbi:hypothetical protein M5689_008356 [Euphorbia peplus]|nr:hypothetical protein M5689_008356 [Euphorbia peplus]